MNNDDFNALSVRVRSLEAHIEAIERRLGLIPPPPPRNYYQDIAAEAATPRLGWGPHSPKPDPDSSSQATNRGDEDLEYAIGAKLLPRVGAVAMLAGLGCLVSLGVSRGWITPAMLFGLACILCGGFIGLGQWLRREREQFGQILVAVGCGGLYMNFAAGHVYQHLYSGEVLVSLCLGLSLAVLGYSFWLGSIPFLVLGSLGGFGAALMPLDKGNVTIEMVLHFAVLFSGLAVALRHRLTTGIVALYVLGMLAAIPAAASPAILHGHHSAPAFTLALTTGLSVLAFAWCFEPLQWDTCAAVIPAALVLGALASLGAGYLGEAWLPLSTLVALVISGALSIATPLARRRLWQGSAAILCWVLPFGLRPFEPAVPLICAALVTALIATSKPSKAALILSAVGAMLGILDYTCSLIDHPWPIWRETSFLLLLISSIVVLCVGWWKAAREFGWNREDPILEVCCLTAGLTLLRLAFVALAKTGVLLQWDVLTLTPLVLSMGCTAMANSLARKGMLAVAFAFVAVAIVGYLNSFPLDIPPAKSAVEILANLALIAAWIYACRALGRTSGMSRTANVIAIGGLWSMLSRLGVVVLGQAGAAPNTALTVTWLFLAAGLYALGFLFDKADLRYGSFVVMGCSAAKIVLIDLAAVDPAIRVVLLMLLGGVMLAAGYWTIKREAPARRTPGT